MKFLSSLIGTLLLLPTFTFLLMTVVVCWPAAWIIRSVLWRFIPEDYRSALDEVIRVILG